MDVLDTALVENALPDIRLFIVLIKIDHIALSEVEGTQWGRIGDIAETKGDAVIATIWVCFLTLDDMEGHDDVTLFLFLVEGHQPKVGTASSCMMECLLTTAQFLCPLLTIDKGHHAFVVGTLCWFEI